MPEEADDTSSKQSGLPIEPVVVEPPADPSDLPSHLLPYPIVAIGGSAGALEAYVDVLKGLPPQTGMTFVLLTHLAPHQESHLIEILSRHTGMKVLPITDGQRPEADHLYVLTPAERAYIEKGFLRLEDRHRGERSTRPIDRFFTSLAFDQKSRAIGVILSGADADGAIGLRTIKGEGGIAIVQTPESARFPQMPLSGIAADHVDIILHPGNIATELHRLAKQFDDARLRPIESGPLPPGDEHHFDRLMNMLRQVSGIDFRLYKPTTVRRRIARRMMLQHFDSLNEYVRSLHRQPDELRNLQEDLLISVTRFFRDPDVFESLKIDLLPRIFQNGRVNRQIRIWVAGCSTGEEVYSVAICLLEYCGSHGLAPELQIFGTDASVQSIEKARAGIYPTTSAEDVGPDRLRQFFVKVESGYQIIKRIREMCVFARQNLCSDPPFSHLDIVSCRNVLIYLGARAQQDIINMFHYSLNPEGFLMLGGSESLAGHSQLFTPLDRKNRFFAKVSSALRPPVEFVPAARQPGIRPAIPVPDAVREGWGDFDLQRAADRILLARYSPPGVLVNSSLEVIQVRGDAAPYLEPAAGSTAPNLTRLVREELAPVVVSTLRRAADEDIPVYSDPVTLPSGSVNEELRIEVLPIQGMPGRPRCYLALFVPVPGHGRPGGPPPGRTDEPGDVSRLQDDLTSTRIYLRSLIEEREARNHELTSAYEELQSSNEELQSSNEELETAKEELQSTNEELQTVNDELRDRNLALMQAGNDLTNLLNSVNIPMLMLSNNLTIRHYTPPIEGYMPVRASDIGRSITEIRLNLDIEGLEPMLVEVQDTLGTKELEVQDRTGRWHILRIRPYRTSENNIEGLVLMLIDIDHIRRSERAMRDARDFSQSVIESIQTPLVVLDPQFRVITANAAFRALAKASSGELHQRSFPDLGNILWHMTDVRSALGTLVEGVRSTDIVFEHTVSDDCVLHVNARSVPVEGSSVILLTIDDITGQKHAERAFQRERERLEFEIQEVSRILGRTKEELGALAGGLLASQEDERRRVARELHDDVSQKLAVLEIYIERLRETLPEARDEIRGRLEELKRSLSLLSEDVRHISHGLHPPVLDDLGLAAGLRNLVEDFEEHHGMPATFSSSGDARDLTPSMAMNLYRICQEALRNVGKHAGKTHVRVALAFSPREVRLSIRDLGEGFDVDQQGTGLGLISMSERARLIGGTLRVHSELGAGSTIEISVPLGKAS